MDKRPADEQDKSRTDPPEPPPFAPDPDLIIERERDRKPTLEEVLKVTERGR